MFANKPVPLLSFTTKASYSQFSTAIFHPFFSSLRANPSLFQTKQAHAHIIISGLAGNASLMGHLLTILALSPSTPFDYSQSIYQTITNPNVFASNNMIRVQLHGHVVKLGFGEDVYVRNALIHLYSSCCKVESSKKVFDESPYNRDVITWNAMLAGFARDGRVDVVESMFDEMPERDVISWNTMIMAYVHNGKLEEGLECFRRMRGIGLIPNEATLVTSRLLFDKMPQRDISTWNVMICGMASHGRGKEAIALFERFLNEGIRPVNVTFIGVLNACSRAGLVKEGKRYFKLMTDNYGIEPEMEHYGCMVDLLGRAGLVSEAIEMIENKVVSPNPVLWATLLCACRIHGLIELGENIGNKLIELDPSYDGHYVQLANIYAKSRKWDEVIRVRRLMAERNTIKLQVGA
ncbi:hypothetical protein GH714_005943 [Hevea brasiliensis]|uniref:Pentacotripeptide-repeat region of PRORP domain-containing protein n=1 Tax=Hevea brasiliensis TaxID=3981 RepID=A0A6A6L152_HEVBR|nr:hypothetical protein GH714_005943 [Hevea brasiliensis]